MEMFSDGTIFLTGVILASAAAVAGVIGPIIYRIKMKRLKNTLNNEYGAITPAEKAQ